MINNIIINFKFKYYILIYFDYKKKKKKKKKYKPLMNLKQHPMLVHI